MANLHLEDEFGDIVRKARTGLGLELEHVANRAGLSEDELKRIERYEFVPEDPVIAALAQALGLRTSSLIEIARRRWLPVQPDLKRWQNVAELRSLYGGNYEVKNYLVWDTSQREAALFDTGIATDAVLKLIGSEKLSLTTIYLTHTHADHIGALSMLSRSYSPRIWVGAGERAAGAKPVKENDTFRLGRLNIRVLETEGHTAGGVTYVVDGFDDGLAPVAFVGDALFAGSVGGAGFSYGKLLANVRAKILGLPEGTVICPGHGPLTTVKQEKAHNPFFP